MAKAIRRTLLVPEIVFVDGLSGSGKTALLMAVSSLKRVEMSRFEHIYEYACALEHVGRISSDATDVLLQIHIDLACYNTMISRSVNFRPGDSSSVLNSPIRNQYLSRLFETDGQDVFSRIKKNKPIMNIMTHQVLGISQPLFRALGKKMSLIEIRRDPLQMVTAWFNYIDRFGADPMELSICIDYKGHDLPWFALGWEEKYLSLNTMDRSIKSIDHLIGLADKQYHILDANNQKQCLIIYFEEFVTNPDPYMKQVEKLLGTESSVDTSRILNDQNIPRRISMDIPDQKDFARYGFIRSKADSESDALNQQWGFVKKYATDEGIRCMERLHEEYHTNKGQK